MAYHVRDMNQLDRMIFEECTVADGAVVAPHINIKPSCPFHLRPEILQKKIGFDFRHANGNLAALGARLYKIQQGAIKLIDSPAKHEWIIIWDAYHDQQASARP